MLDALTYSLSLLHTTARTYDTSLSAEKNLVPERQKAYQVRLIRLVSSRVLYSLGLFVAALPQAHLLPPSPLTPLSRYSIGFFLMQ
jgi:hypothetical protein